MSPNNPIANWDQISVCYIPSVPGAHTEMYLLHFCICHTFGTQCEALETIVDFGDYWNLNFEINLNLKLNIEIYYGKGA